MKWILTVLGIVLMSASRAAGGERRRPAVLFYGYAPHASYLARPLAPLGVEVDTCAAGKLAETLARRRHNVVVVGTMGEADREIVDGFLAGGGGVLVCNPTAYPREKEFTGTCEWLERMGARPRWETLRDGDAGNVVAVTFGRLSWSDQVSSPVNGGVPGVLTVLSDSTTGREPAMSWDFGPGWDVVVRGARTLATRNDPRNDPVLQPWIPAKEVAESPALMGLRQLGKGRIAVIPFRDHWIFCPPANCPPTEAMLRYDRGEKRSAWILVLANAFRWLAQPSLRARVGGARTPETILHPPAQPWEEPAQIDWTRACGALADQPDMPQNAGLVGARTELSSGKGTVADYVRAAKEAGLRFLVFFEDALRTDEARFDRLIEQCRKASDDSFAAVPGLSYEDAQGDHLYVLGDQVRYPKQGMLLEDRRLKTTHEGRTKAYFDYINEYIGQKALTGFWRHRENFLHFSDYKLYNSFPIYSFENGRPVDEALPEYLYWQNIGGLQAALALEVMDSPDRVAERARAGWKVVWNRDLEALREGKWHEGAWSFSGMGSQYVTSGPSILVWQTVNALTEPNGRWWRPDRWEWRLRLRVGSEAGLRSVTLYDADRRVLRRWLPTGRRRFEQELVFSNSQQVATTLVVDDAGGGRAVSMAYWNRNLNMEEFFCTDRCNILGSCRLRRKSDGAQYWTPVGMQGNMGCTPSKAPLFLWASVTPAVSLTPDMPTIPVDGAPHGLPAAAIRFLPQVPGEHPLVYDYPSTYLVSPEITVGQANYRLSYDPAEKGATLTPLGHPYAQPQHGWGNSWGGWHRLVPNRKLEGWIRLHVCNWLTEGFRIGWVEMRARCRESVEPGRDGFVIAATRGVVYKDRKPIGGASGPFGRGAYSLLEDGGGATVVIGVSDRVIFQQNGDNLVLRYQPERDILLPGEEVEYTFAFAGASARTRIPQMLDFVEKFGVAAPGRAAYAPEMKAGKTLDTYLLWRTDAEGRGIAARLPRAAMPGFLSACVENLNDNWSVQLLDRARAWPNHRALPIRDGRAFAQLDLNDADQDLFIGHPVLADRREVVLQVAWKSPGLWHIEAHNPTDQPLRARLTANPAWGVFAFDQGVDLPPGSSRHWDVAGRGAK